jgi:hypothetical protein
LLKAKQPHTSKVTFFKYGQHFLNLRDGVV